MENTNTKVEMIKAGIPIAVVTIAGLIIAKIIQKKCSFSESSCIERPRDSLENVTLQEEIIDLKARVEDVHGRARELGSKIDHYNQLKEQEKLLMELENKSLVEISKIELLEREISLLQAESQRFENTVAEFLKIVEMLEFSRSENRSLCKKVKMLKKKIEQLSRVVNTKDVQIKAKEAEASRNLNELENKKCMIEKIEEEMKRAKMAFEELQNEKNELLMINRFEMVQNVDSSESGHRELVNEMEKLQESKALGEKELVYLRWSNACLRHQLMMRTNREDENQTLETTNNGESRELFESDNHELRVSSMANHKSCLGFSILGHSREHSKRKKLVHKFKKWSEKMKHRLDDDYREKHETSTSGELMIPPRKSCSSV